MSNPIFDMLNSASNNQNGSRNTNGPMGMLSVMSMINQIRRSPNPNAAMRQMAANNPALQNTMDYIQASGGNAKNAFYNMAAQKGVDPNAIIQSLQQLE